MRGVPKNPDITPTTGRLSRPGLLRPASRLNTGRPSIPRAPTTTAGRPNRLARSLSRLGQNLSRPGLNLRAPCRPSLSPIPATVLSFYGYRNHINFQINS